jgi:hypothetical protein
LTNDKFLLDWVTVWIDDYDEVMFFNGIVEDTLYNDNGSVGACLARYDRIFGNVTRIHRHELDAFDTLLRRSVYGKKSVPSDQDVVLRSLVKQRTAAIRSLRDTVTISQSIASM